MAAWKSGNSWDSSSASKRWPRARRRREIARLGHLSRVRVTQIMNLLLLAPDIHEAILFLPRTQRGRG